jgi:hypothetical protein
MEFLTGDRAVTVPTTVKGFRVFGDEPMHRDGGEGIGMAVAQRAEPLCLAQDSATLWSELLAEANKNSSAIVAGPRLPPRQQIRRGRILRIRQ